MHKSVLMCRPTYYSEGNPKQYSEGDNKKGTVDKYGNTWRKVYNNKINSNKALNQWRSLVKILVDNDLEVHETRGDIDCQNQVFMANAGLVYNNKVLLSVFRNESRKPETNANEIVFKSLGYSVEKSDYIFEGEGDAIFTHNNQKVWLSHGFRSNPDCVQQLQSFVEDAEVITLKLVNPLWYHLDTCFLPLEENCLLICKEAFDKTSLEKIYSSFERSKIIEISKTDSMQFACNSILIPGRKIVTYKMSSPLKKILGQLNYSVIETDMSEFVIAGGSVKCTVCNLSHGW